jgi:predicted DNA-binding transcriptional regulator YafY
VAERGWCVPDELFLGLCRSAMKSRRLTRLLELLNLLQSAHATSSGDLAVALGCSRRTIFRDIKALRQSGVDVRFAREEGAYVATSDNSLPTSHLEEGECVAVLVAALMSPLSQTEAFAGKVSQGVAKLMGKARPQVRRKVNVLLRSIAVEACRASLLDPQKEVFEKIIDALCERRQVRIYYRFGDHKDLQCTKISSYRLTPCESGWSLIARSSIHRGVVQFDLSGIEKVEPTGDRYAIPLRYLQSSSGSSMRLGGRISA